MQHGDRAGLDLGEVEEIVDQPEEIHARRIDGLREAHLLRVEPAAGIVGEQARQDQQAVERRPQLVRHVGEELRLRFARALRFGLGAHQLRLDALSLRKVARHLGEADELAALVVHRAQHHARPECRAVLAHAPALLRQAALARRHLEVAAWLAGRDVLREVEAREVLADDFVGVVALDALGARVPARDAPFGVKHADRVVHHALDHQAKAPFGLGERPGALLDPRLELVARGV